VLVLALDSATPAVTAGVVALGDGPPEVLARCVTVDARAHGELLTPHILTALAQADRTLADVDAIVCGVGPGPFTGLRAGMATAAALGHALDVPVHPVCSLDAIAAATPAGAPLLVVTDARRREVYWAVYDDAGARIDGPAVAKPAAAAERAAELGVTRAAGHGVGLYPETLALPPAGPAHPTPEGLVLAARTLGGEPDPLVPLYLRRPDATVPGARKRVTAP
jgi:tRNA threonylcarbamoyladenosine biosynthesis protein TsaB